MNEKQFNLFDDEVANQWSDDVQLMVCGRLFTMLGNAARLADEGCVQEAWYWLHKASEEGYAVKSKHFMDLYFPIARHITSALFHREADYVSAFAKNISAIIDGAEVVARKNNTHHQPDLWVKVDDELIPVEAKLREFDKKALLQLQRYMTFYKAENGIALGSRLDVDLPNNIAFYSHKEVENIVRKWQAENVEVRV